MKEEDSGLDSLIKGGLIGVFLGAVLSKDKKEGAVIGAILGVVFPATQRANRAAIA